MLHFVQVLHHTEKFTILYRLDFPYLKKLQPFFMHFFYFIFGKKNVTYQHLVFKNKKNTTYCV
ncbi:hypothetical protein DDU33_10530 [Actinobacillus porcitonsillarum]|uniref:Uncharacterized protein n=1 Tax=Actinobacillus porcitonsillarum TaxID=189834 RepID=A0A2U8FNB4_9PAST|nr:hypothetical protein DDU33_10530 [Actinobacillus porcitonsillarum]